jgi:predicted metal-dependent phosphotriesterase family hydrolase
VVVRSVLGDLAPDELGVTDSHDHVFFRSPLLPGQEVDDPEAAGAELSAFAELGGRTVVQWTPFGMGRRPQALVELARVTGVNVVAATGLHQAAHYDPSQLESVYPRLSEIFVDDLTRGMRDSDARAGLIKVAGEYHHLDQHARRTMTAAAEAHHATGAPIAVHLELGTAALDVLELLCSELDVRPANVILGHLNRSPDQRMHRDVASAGAFICFDGPSRAHHATDSRLLDSIIALAEADHADQLLLGADTTTARARAATGEGPGMPFLLSELRLRIEREHSEALATKILVENPARAFAADWRADRACLPR